MDKREREDDEAAAIIEAICEDYSDRIDEVIAELSALKEEMVRRLETEGIDTESIG